MATRTREEVLITPTIAAEWLSEYNKPSTAFTNRVKRNRWVEDYARAMRSDRWNLHNIHGNTIILVAGEGIDGWQVADGQHRLTAISLSGVSIAMDVVRVSGLTLSETRNLYSTLDRGKPRTIGDLIASLDVPELQEFNREDGNAGLRAVMIAEVLIPLGFSAYGQLDSIDWENFLYNHSEDVAWCASVRRSQGAAFRKNEAAEIRAIPQGVIACLLNARKVDREVAEIFAYYVSTGNWTGPGEAAYTLRKQIGPSKGGGTISQSVPMQEEWYRITANAWNRFATFYEDQGIKHLRPQTGYQLNVPDEGFRDRILGHARDEQVHIASIFARVDTGTKEAIQYTEAIAAD